MNGWVVTKHNLPHTIGFILAEFTNNTHTHKFTKLLLDNIAFGK